MHELDFLHQKQVTCNKLQINTPKKHSLYTFNIKPWLMSLSHVLWVVSVWKRPEHPVLFFILQLKCFLPRSYDVPTCFL